MADHKDDEQFDIESGFSEEEKREVRDYIDAVSSENRLPAETATFDRKSARPGLLMPVLVNAAAVVGILIGVIVLRSAFEREEAGVQNQAIEYASIEGRLIRELRAESQEQILAKEREIEAVREQLRVLEREQADLDADIEARIAEREGELRAEIEAEIGAERTRLIAEGLDNDEIDRLMAEFEAEREAWYDQQIASYRAQLDEERVALQNEIDTLRSEYQDRLTELERQRQEILAEFQEREDDLRVQLEQRTRVLEVARVEATADLEAAQRELAELERTQENTAAIQNQIIGQIEAIQGAIVDGDDARALARIDALTAFLNEDQVLEIADLARRRDIDLFLLRQLRSLVEEEVAVNSGERSITQELRVLSEIRRLGDSTGAPNLQLARQTFDVLLSAIPNLSPVYDEVIQGEREQALEDREETERGIIESGTASAATLRAAGQYRQALDTYIAALDGLPATAPASEQIVSDVLQLGYALTDYVIDGEESDEIREIARRAAIDLEGERRQFTDARDAAVRAAVARREADLEVQINDLEDEIAELDNEIIRVEAELAVARDATPEDVPGIRTLPEDEYARLVNQRDELQAENQEMRDSLLASQSDALELQIDVEQLTADRDRIQDQRDRLQEEKRRLTVAYERYREEQADALTQGENEAAVLARTEFLSSDIVSDFMPGFLFAMEEYDDASREADLGGGLDSDLVAEIMRPLEGMSDAEKTNYLRSEVRFALDDDEVVLADFLEQLALTLGLSL